MEDISQWYYDNFKWNMIDRYSKLHEQDQGSRKRGITLKDKEIELYWVERGMKCHLEYKDDMRLYEGGRMMEKNKDVGKVRL